MSEESSKVGHTKWGGGGGGGGSFVCAKDSVIFVSFSVHMLLSDI